MPPSLNYQNFGSIELLYLAVSTLVVVALTILLLVLLWEDDDKMVNRCIPLALLVAGGGLSNALFYGLIRSGKP